MSSEDENMIAGLSQNKIVDCCIYEAANAGHKKLCDPISTAKVGTVPPFPWRKTLSISGNWLGEPSAIPGPDMRLNYNQSKFRQGFKRPKI
jgi:hypothetical protein